MVHHINVMLTHHAHFPEKEKEGNKLCDAIQTWTDHDDEELGRWWDCDLIIPSRDRLDPVCRHWIRCDHDHPCWSWTNTWAMWAVELDALQSQASQRATCWHCECPLWPLPVALQSQTQTLEPPPMWDYCSWTCRSRAMRARVWLAARVVLGWDAEWGRSFWRGAKWGFGLRRVSLTTLTMMTRSDE